jgi:predicted porin
MRLKTSAGFAMIGITTLLAAPAQATSTFDALMNSIQTYRSAGGNGVTLYGTVDAGVEYYKAGTNSATRLISGGASTSRFGITGGEDLGGGLQVRFVLESAVNLANGVAGSTTLQGDSSLFNREANISLISVDWGQLKLGRQYPLGSLPLFVDPFFGVSSFSIWSTIGGLGSDLGPGASRGDSRVSNAISYASPSLAGLTASVLYAPRGVTTNGYPSYAYLGAQTEFARGPLYLGAGYNAVRSDPTTAVRTVTTQTYGVAAIYDFGIVMPSYSFQLVLPQLAGDHVAQVHSLGFIIPVDHQLLRASIVYRNVAGSVDKNSLGVSVGYDYNVSKRTALYARAGYVHNQKKAIGDVGLAELSAAGVSPKAFAVGIRQRF